MPILTDAAVERAPEAATVTPQVIRHAVAVLDLFDRDPAMARAEQLHHMCENARTVRHPNPAAPAAYRLAARVAGLPEQGPDTAPVPPAAPADGPACDWCDDETCGADYRVGWTRDPRRTAEDVDLHVGAHCLPEVIADSEADPWRVSKVRIDDLDDTDRDVNWQRAS